MARRRKSQKKRKEKLAVVEEAKEGGNGAKGQAAKIKGQAAEIEGLTQAGQQALGLQDVRGALACFRKAFLLSLGTTSPRLRRVCSFNLGAAYVEAGKPRKGLKFLLESQPAEGEPFGGLYFNIGAAGEGLRDFPKALECFGQAAGPCRAGSQAVEMGCCYLGMQEPARAARCFLEAAHSYAVAESPEAAAVALSRASGSMLQSRRFGVAEIARILTWCRSLCDSIADPTLRGKLYNEVGLGFSQLHVFSLASESFERALALCQGSLGRRGEAALLQNLGAARNALRSFGTALGLHRRAAELHGAVGNRRAQGQCFGNLAYAFSQLGNHEAAAENYLHALQAFRDSGDVQGQWQACEGLGAACFHLGNPQKAIGHYQEALTLLSRCRGTPRAAGERIVSQLSHALQHQLCLHRHPSYWGAPEPGHLCVAPRPPVLPAGAPQDLNPPQFCSVLPRASGTRLQGSEVFFREKAGDELHQPALGAQPRMPEGHIAWCWTEAWGGSSGERSKAKKNLPGTIIQAARGEPNPILLPTTTQVTSEPHGGFQPEARLRHGSCQPPACSPFLPGGTGAAAPAPDPTAEPQAPHRHPASSEEDEDGPSTSPGHHSQPHVNGT
eukprot:XP_027300313.1 tetratricopeptide repeat protein 24 isoform X2 [Anas platyrhynchos]